MLYDRLTVLTASDLALYHQSRCKMNFEAAGSLYTDTLAALAKSRTHPCISSSP
jgi:hypothetical protein